jgi:hypothetical protein
VAQFVLDQRVIGNEQIREAWILFHIVVLSLLSGAAASMAASALCVDKMKDCHIIPAHSPPVA